MSYRWVCEPEPAGAAPAGLDGGFPDQASAEAWLGASYPELAEAGVAQVSLYEFDRLVYGPMSLAP